MILRNAMTYLFGVGSLLLVADSCAASPFPGGRPLRDRAAGYELTVLVDGVPARTYMHGGETYVLGQLGSRYTLRISNHTGRRIEAVVSVDGRDAIDGKPADWRSKRGYLVPAWGSVDIEGWRISHAQAAAFRFSSVPDSYAARTGSARDVGVIGVAVFPERVHPAARLPRAAAPPLPSVLLRRTTTTTTAAGPTRAARRARGPKRARRLPPSAPPPPASAHAAARRGRRGRFGRLRQGRRRRGSPAVTRAGAAPASGTEYGEAVNSRIYEVTVRARQPQPSERRAGRPLQRP